MITIPAMHPCPELHIDADVPELRLIAHTMTQIHQHGSNRPLCLQHVYLVGNGWEADRAQEAFELGMRNAIKPHVYLTGYLIQEKKVERAAAFRPLWAAHIARSIYEQIGA